MRAMFPPIILFCAMPLLSGPDAARRAIQSATQSLYLRTDDPDCLSLALKSLGANIDLKIIVTLDAAKRSHGDDLKRLLNRGAEVWVAESMAPSGTVAVADRERVGDSVKGEFSSDAIKAQDCIREWEYLRTHTIPCK